MTISADIIHTLSGSQVMMPHFNILYFQLLFIQGLKKIKCNLQK